MILCTQRKDEHMDLVMKILHDSHQIFGFLNIKKAYEDHKNFFKDVESVILWQ